MCFIVGSHIFITLVMVRRVILHSSSTLEMLLKGKMGRIYPLGGNSLQSDYHI